MKIRFCHLELRFIFVTSRLPSLLSLACGAVVRAFCGRRHSVFRSVLFSSGLFLRSPSLLLFSPRAFLVPFPAARRRRREGTREGSAFCFLSLSREGKRRARKTLFPAPERIKRTGRGHRVFLFFPLFSGGGKARGRNAREKGKKRRERGTFPF
jgi:hypothetical protein